MADFTLVICISFTKVLAFFGMYYHIGHMVLKHEIWLGLEISQLWISHIIYLIAYAEFSEESPSFESRP